MLRSLVKEHLPLHVVVDVGSFNGGRDNPAELYFIKKAVRSLGGIIAHSSIQSAYYKKYMPHIPYRFIHFGVDAEYFQPLSLPEEDYVLSFGSRARDYPTLIRAWKKIDPKRTRLKIIGIDKIQNSDHGRSRVEIVGRLPVQSLIQEIAKARFIVLPLPFCRYSCGQMSFLQSMAMGKSCIVTLTPSSQDYLTNNQDAVCVRPSDPDDLAEKIDLLLQNETMKNAIARKARLTIEAKYNEIVMAKEICSFIKSIT
jgi:glycosyltransferase involved in cell wall biosynthesis